MVFMTHTTSMYRFLAVGVLLGALTACASDEVTPATVNSGGGGGGTPGAGQTGTASLSTPTARKRYILVVWVMKAS